MKYCRREGQRGQDLFLSIEVPVSTRLDYGKGTRNPLRNMQDGTVAREVSYRKLRLAIGTLSSWSSGEGGRKKGEGIQEPIWAHHRPPHSRARSGTCCPWCVVLL